MKNGVLNLDDVTPLDRKRSIDTSDKNIPMLSIVKKIATKRWLIAPFQRDFVWNPNQIRGWIESIIKQDSVGVIVTYQIDPLGPTFLADGMQRATATSKFIKEPQLYGFSFDPLRAEQYCEDFEVTVQHRGYASHPEAMVAFQNLNRGTHLNPQEFYAGELMLDERGALIVNRIPNMVFKVEGRLRKDTLKARNLRAKYTRDAYALWLQYASRDKRLDFWDAGNSKVFFTGMHIERACTEYLKNNQITPSELEKSIVEFVSYLETIAAELETIIKDCGAWGNAPSAGFLRMLFHLKIFARNSDIPVSEFISFTTKLITHQFKDHGGMPGRYNYQKENGAFENAHFKIGKIPLSDLEKIVGTTFGVNKRKRSGKKSGLRPGYHISHIKPVSLFGEGETIIEAGLRNIARGNRSFIEDKERSIEA